MVRPRWTQLGSGSLMESMETSIEGTGLDSPRFMTDSAFAGRSLHKSSISAPKWPDSSGYPGHRWRSLRRSAGVGERCEFKLCCAASAGPHRRKRRMRSEFYHWIATAGDTRSERDSATESQRVRTLPGAWAPAALHGFADFSISSAWKTAATDGILDPGRLKERWHDLVARTTSL